jgi:type I restriction enzyme R subunit
VEAKPEGTTLSGIADQSAYYGDSLPDLFRQRAACRSSMNRPEWRRFSVTSATRTRARAVSLLFTGPETLAAWMKDEHTLRFRLAQMGFAHSLATEGMRDCQIEAITQLEQSLAHAHPRALIQMATGAGKTFTACAFIYRLIKFAGAKRVLFLVDRANLGRQATGEFHQFVTPDTGRKFTELYNVQHLQSNKLDDVSRVTICTIQRLYSMLRGEELPEDADELSTYEIGAADGRPKEVAYNPNIPIEAFDFIVTDECHRSIYNLWRQVLEYFDSFLVGLTATPSKQTIGFFNGNLVTEYNHERAVADGVNVGYEVYRIKTDVTEHGGKVEKGFYIDRRSKETRKRRWEQLDEDLPTPRANSTARLWCRRRFAPCCRRSRTRWKPNSFRAATWCPKPWSSPKTIRTPRTSCIWCAKCSARETTSPRKSPIRRRTPKPAKRPKAKN